MEIIESSYKGVFALILKTKNLSITCLPFEGGKIASVKRLPDEKEFLLQNPSKQFLSLGENGDFVQTECAGFDDMFPTIDSVVVKDGDRKGKVYPDHGEVCRLKHNYKIEDGKLCLFVNSTALNYNFQKRFYENADGSISADYSINNLGGGFNCLYAAHCLVDTHGAKDVFCSLKSGCDANLMFDMTELFGKNGDRKKLSEDMLYLSDKFDSKTCYKLYTINQSPKGYVGVSYTDGSVFKLGFDGLDYLGLWFNNGYLNGANCVGLEPCSLPFDTVYNAEKYGLSGVVGDKPVKFTITISVQLR